MTVRDRGKRVAIPIEWVFAILDQPDYDDITEEDRLNKLRYGDGVPVLQPYDYFQPRPR